MRSRQLMVPITGNDTQAPILLGLSGGLLLVAVLLLCARFWSRLRNLKADDWTVMGGTILAIVNFCLVSFACSYGFGRRTAFVTPTNRRAALRLIFILQVIFYWSITLVKFSVALLLLRLKPTRRWKIFLYTTMTLLLLTLITQTLFQFLQCRPFRIYWDPRASNFVQCIPRAVINTNIITNSTIHVTTDLVFSFIPITFIHKLHRPRSEKIFLSTLMGLGLFASSFAVLRTAGLATFYVQEDFFRMNVMPTLWAMLELEVALIAATVPTLRAFVHRVLVRMGALFYEEESERQIRERLVALGFLVDEEVGGGVVRSEREAKRLEEFDFEDTLVERGEVWVVSVKVRGKDGETR